MIQIKLELGPETTTDDLVRFCELAKEYGNPDDLPLDEISITGDGLEHSAILSFEARDYRPKRTTPGALPIIDD